MDEETLRRIEIESSATRFIAEAAFVTALQSLPRSERAKMLSMFLAVSKKSDHLRAENESVAEWTADVFVQTQEAIAHCLVKVAELVEVKLELGASDEE